MNYACQASHMIASIVLLPLPSWVLCRLIGTKVNKVMVWQQDGLEFNCRVCTLGKANKLSQNFVFWCFLCCDVYAG